MGLYPDKGTGWLPITTAPANTRDVHLAAYDVPSAEAARNGQRPMWHYGIGSNLYGDHWSNVLTASPSHWKPLEAHEAYALDCERRPTYQDGTPRARWEDLDKAVRQTWINNPTPYHGDACDD